MRAKVIIRLLVACCICGTVLWHLECDLRKNDSQTHRSRLLPYPLKDVAGITLYLKNGDKVVLEASPSGWNMASPSQGRANAQTVQRLLDALEQAPLLDRLDQSTINDCELKYEDFGFSNPITDKENVILEPRFNNIYFQVGNCDAVTNGLFVLLRFGKNRESHVYVTTPSLRDFFLLTSADYMDRRVFQCNMSMVHTVILRRPTLGDVKLVRDERNRLQWNIAQPVGARADWDVVGHLFDVLADATFIENYPEANKAPASGLGQSEAPSVTLFSKNDLAGQTLVLGDRVPGNADITYARGPTGVMTVTGAVRRIVLTPAYEFRDRRLFPSTKVPEVQSFSIDTEGRSLALRRAGGGWSVTAPVSDAADSDDAAALIQEILSLRAESFAPYTLQTTTQRIASVTLALGRDRTPFSFTVYALQSEANGRIGILPEGLDALYLAPAQAFSNILDRCVDPRPLISRNILAINEDHVRAVTISGPVETQRIEKVSGEWNAATPGFKVDEVAVRRLFGTVASLRAEAVASLAPSEALPLAGGAEIAFDMDDGTTLRRILAIGPRQEGGHPAALKGRDIVFILSPETATALTRPLFAPEAPVLGEVQAAPPQTDKESK